MLQARVAGPGKPHVESIRRISDHMTEVVSSLSAQEMDGRAPDTPGVPAGRMQASLVESEGFVKFNS